MTTFILMATFRAEFINQRTNGHATFVWKNKTRFAAHSHYCAAHDCLLLCWMAVRGAAIVVVGVDSLHQFDLARSPALVEERWERAVVTQELPFWHIHGLSQVNKSLLAHFKAPFLRSVEIRNEPNDRREREGDGKFRG
jgi:hypothetical protein